jgi:hypothetical protein
MNDLPYSSSLGDTGLVHVHVVASARIKRIPFKPVRRNRTPAMAAIGALGACETVAAHRAPHPLMPRRARHC